MYIKTAKFDALSTVFCYTLDKSYILVWVFACLYHFRLSEQSQNNFHHAHCYVPAEVKYVLDQKPSLISPIVQAFYERDPIDMKVCYATVLCSPCVLLGKVHVHAPSYKGLQMWCLCVTGIMIMCPLT